MLFLRQSSKYKNIRILEKTGDLQFILLPIEEYPESMNGSFDVIRTTDLSLFFDGESLVFGLNGIYHQFRSTRFSFRKDLSFRFLKMHFEDGTVEQISYTLSDLGVNTNLLIGSYEEEEDYDFGIWLRNISENEERQSLLELSYYRSI
ncbi:MAG: hypothetical protein QM496_05915 [Verrucomicrobiota bacterium]